MAEAEEEEVGACTGRNCIKAATVARVQEEKTRVLVASDCYGTQDASTFMRP